MYLIPNQGHHGEFEPGKDQCFDGLFLYKSVSYKLWKNSKVFNCRAKKRNGTQNDREKNCF